MRRPILIFVVLTAAILATVLFAFFKPTSVSGIEVRQDPMVLVDHDALVTEGKYQFRAMGLRSNDEVFWTAESHNAHIDIIAENVLLPNYVFQDTGWYVLRCEQNDKLVATDSVHVRQGDRFIALQQHEPSKADTVGTTIYLVDRSINVETRDWRIRKSGADVMEPKKQENWTWTPMDTGHYSIRLETTLKNTKVTHSDSIFVFIDFPPKPEAVVEVVTIPKPIPVPKPKPEPKPISAPKPKPEPEPKPAPKAKPEPKPLPPPPATACFAQNRTMLGKVKVEMPDPLRKDVRWQKGVTEFELDVHEDCKLRTVSYFANSNAGMNRVAVTISCLNTDCTEPRELTTTFIPAMDSQGAAKKDLSLNVVLMAGKQYRVRVVPQGEEEYLGFFDISTAAINTPTVGIKFSQPTSCVFDLVFLK